MRDYENKLRSDGVTTIGKLGGVVEQLEGTILRISGEYSGGNTVYKFLLSEKPDILFIAESTAGAELALTQPNDKIQVEYSLSSDGTAEVTSFDNLLFTQKAVS